MHEIFISYSTKDKDLVFQITKKLEDAGLKIWIAPHDINTGIDYEDSIIEAIEKTNVFLLFISKNSLQSEDVKSELTLARSEGKQIVPFRLDDSPLKSKFRYYLSSTQHISVDKKNLDDSIDKLVHEIKEKLNKEKFLPEMVLAESGSFVTDSNEEILLTYDFLIGKYEITFEQYGWYCEINGISLPNDEHWGRGKRPVINVRWWDCIRYCNWLSNLSNLPIAYDQNGYLLDADGKKTDELAKVQGYRLPTKAEWEYAAYGGHKRTETAFLYSGSDNLKAVGWYWVNSGDRELSGYRSERKISLNNCRTHEVGEKMPNSLGIFDMSGNVWEWCYDNYIENSPLQKENPVIISDHPEQTEKVEKGGSFSGNPHYAQINYTGKYEANAKRKNLGFRIVKTPE